KVADSTVTKSILGVLAVVAYSIMRDRSARSAASEQAARVEELLTSIDARLNVSSEIEIVAPEGIGGWVAGAWGSATRWHFKGGTGTYLRAETLPALALSREKVVDVRAEILPPDQPEVCEAYSEHRQVAQNPTRTWSLADVRIESYAT